MTTPSVSFHVAFSVRSSILCIEVCRSRKGRYQGTYHSTCLSVIGSTWPRRNVRDTCKLFHHLHLSVVLGTWNSKGVRTMGHLHSFLAFLSMVWEVKSRKSDITY